MLASGLNDDGRWQRYFQHESIRVGRWKCIILHQCHKEVRSTNFSSSCSQSFSDKSIGPVCKELFFVGFRSLQYDENAFQTLTAINFSIFAVLLSLLPRTPRKMNELSVEKKVYGLPFSVLSELLSVHKMTASKSLLVNIQAARKWLYWLSQTAVLATLPPCF